MRTNRTGRRWPGAVLIATLWLPGSPVEAQTSQSGSQPVPLSLEQIMQVETPSVVGASRFAQQVVDAPATVTIVTSDEIERFGYRTFTDVLRGVRGFYVNYDRNYSYVGSRGFLRPGDYDSRILVLIDGHRVNDNIYDTGPVGTDFPVDLELIDRVEIVRGPSSSLYGTSAFFAVINVVTRKGSTARSEAGVSAGSQTTLQGRAVFARRFPNAGEVQLSASQYGSDGAKEVPVDASGLSTFDMDRDRATRLFGTYSKGRWTAQGVFSNRTKGIPTGAYSVSLTDPASQTTDQRGFVNLRYEGAVRGTSLLWSGAYDWYTYNGVYSDNVTEDHLKDFAYGKWWDSEVTASRRLQKHLVTAGAEVRDNVQQDQGIYYPLPDGGRDWLISDQRTSSQWALYGQDEFKPARRIILSAGIRYDHWPSFGGTANPRVGFIFKPRPNTSLKVLHGTAFRAPNLYELYYYGDFSQQLKPEHIRTSEVAWEQYLSGPTRVTVSGFQYHVRDLISQVAVEGIFEDIGFANVGVTDASGIEAEVERNWGHVQVLGNYTFTSTRNDDGGVPLSNSPRHLAVGRFTTPLLKRRATLGVEWLYTSSRRTLTGETTSGFALGNVTLTSGELSGRLKLSVDVHNLLDREYSDPGGEEHLGPIRQDGRTARAKLTWRF
jgi:outer membrane receptor for ferrienterochelin and colicins